MTKYNKARRAFLIQTAAGVSAAATTAVLPPTEARAQSLVNEPTTMPMQHQPSPSRGGEGPGAFFNVYDAQTVAAMTERIMPGAPGKPGAKDADVLNYIDLALAGAYSHQQAFYRQGLAQLDAYCMATFQKPFVSLAEIQQDEVIGALESGKAAGFEWPHSQAFFNTIRTHTMEGMFADPVYGGNKDYAGWRLVGFPGAQVYFTPEDLKSSDRFTRMPIVGMKS